MTLSALVFVLSTGGPVLVADSRALCDSWLASNATRLHGAMYANGVTEWSDPPDDKHCLPIPGAP